MCVASMIGDHYRDKWNQPSWPVLPTIIHSPGEITRAEFDQLKKEVLELKELLKRAKEYDERNGEPDCEMDEKMELLRKVAALVGVDLADAIGFSKNKKVCVRPRSKKSRPSA